MWPEKSKVIERCERRQRKVEMERVSRLRKKKREERGVSRKRRRKK